MVKRKGISKVEKWVKEDRGIGSRTDYQPWIKIQDVSSRGWSNGGFYV
ncbi:hypothetical protein [Amphibacillus sediminis]|nr:hypothetical protein [Amphibacillus sediminis]